jgi:hypothetical protein
MGNSWQTQEQRQFFDKHLTLYCSNRDKGNLKEDFWPMIMEEWFKLWPLAEPPAELVEKKGPVEKAQRVLKDRKIDVSVLERRLVLTLTYS